MSNRSARTLAPATHALPLRAAVMNSFRARVKTLPLPPESLAGIVAALQSGLTVGTENSQPLDAVRDLRRDLYHAPGRDAEAGALWHEAVATAAFASLLAEESGASLAVAACGGLFHRAGEAFALRSVALAESEHGVRIDSPSKSELCSTHGRVLIERLVREWNLPAEVGACVLGWRRFGEFATVSREACAVYTGHCLAAELLHPYLTATGALDSAGPDLNMDSAALERVRARSSEVRELVATLK